jgi:hypothetical protein
VAVANIGIATSRPYLLDGWLVVLVGWVGVTAFLLERRLISLATQGADSVAPNGVAADI